MPAFNTMVTGTDLGWDSGRGADITSAHVRPAADAARPAIPPDPAVPRRTTVLLVNPDESMENFSLSPNGQVWHQRVSKSQGPRHASPHNTGLAVSLFNVARLPNGCRLVVGARGLSLLYCCETAPGSSQWEPAREALLKPLRGTRFILKILVQHHQEQLMVGVMTQRTSDMGFELLELWDGSWQQDRLVFCGAPTRATSTRENLWLPVLAREMPNIERYGPVYRRRQDP